jgi:hypothetical protein
MSEDARCECGHRLFDHQHGVRLFHGCLVAGCQCNQYKERCATESIP